MAEGTRMFRLDRIKSIELTDDTFEPPPEAETQMPPPLVYVPGPDDIEVKLRVAGGVATFLEDYLPVEHAKDVRGGRREIVFRTSHFPWLEKLLLRFGNDLEVVEPPELAERLRAGAKDILALYPTPKRRR